MFEEVPDYGFEIFDLLVQSGLGDSSRVVEVAFVLFTVPRYKLPFFSSSGCIRVFVVLPFFSSLACDIKEDE